MDHSKKNFYIAVICQFLAVIIFSFHYIAAQNLLKVLDVYAFIVLRGVLGGLTIFLMQYLFFRSTLKQRSTIEYKDLLQIFAMILTSFVVCQLFFTKGISSTSSTIAALWANMLPLLVYGIAIVFNLEHKTRKKNILLLLSTSGVSAYFFYKLNIESFEHNIGSLWVFLSFVSLAASLVISKVQMNVLHPATLAGMILLGGGILVGIAVRPDLIFALKVSFSTIEFIWLFFFEVCVTALAWFLNFKAIETLGPAKTSFLNYLQIPLSAIFSFFYASHQISMATVVLSLWIIPIAWLFLKSK